MIVTVLYRKAGSPKVSTGNDFQDVPENEYYATPVNYSVANGVVKGIDENTFAPNVNITRQQLVAILYRYAQAQNVSVDIKNKNVIRLYDDYEDIEEYAREPFAWAIEQGLVTGRTETELAPRNTATRAEVATIMTRFEKIVK